MDILNNIFSIGEKVYLKTDRDQNEMLVTGILLRNNKLISYGLTFGSNEETWHYDFEISKEKDYTK